MAGFGSKSRDTDEGRNHVCVMVVDDDPANRDLLQKYLRAEGYQVLCAVSAGDALRLIEAQTPDLILLDIVMPDVDGISMLTSLKQDPVLTRIPVIMLSALTDFQSIVRSIELGAEDHLAKPFNRTLLRVRMNAVLERRRLEEEERKQSIDLQAALMVVERERKTAEDLILNILPTSVSRELQESGTVRPTYFDDVTVGFADIVGFSAVAESLPADELVGALHEFFCAMDDITGRYQLEKLKTIGDCYMFVGGMPTRSRSHCVDMVLASMEMLQLSQRLPAVAQLGWKLRIGLHTGPVIAGVVGKRKFNYDVWGESVNIAARMEEFGVPDRICLSPITFTRIKDFFVCERRAPQTIWDGRATETHLLSDAAWRQESTDPISADARASFRKRYQRYFLANPPSFPGEP